MIVVPGVEDLRLSFEAAECHTLDDAMPVSCEGQSQGIIGLVMNAITVRLVRHGVCRQFFIHRAALSNSSDHNDSPRYRKPAFSAPRTNSSCSLSSETGMTRRSPRTGMKFVSPPHRGTTCKWR